MERSSLSKLINVQIVKSTKDFYELVKLYFKIHLEAKVLEASRCKNIRKRILKNMEINIFAVKIDHKMYKRDKDLGEQILVAEH